MSEPTGEPPPPGDGCPDLDRVCLDNLLDGDFDSVFFLDREGRFLRASRGLAYQHGFDDATQLVGVSAYSLMPPDEALRAAGDDRSIIATGVPVVELQEHRVRPGQEDAWYVTTKQPLRAPDGTVIGIAGITRDVTARKLMERRVEAHADEVAHANAELRRVERELRLILDSSPDAMTRLDHDQTIRYLNPAAVRMLEFAAGPGAQAIGRRLSGLGVSRSGIGEVDAAVRRVLRNGVDAELEISVPGLNGGQLHLHVRVVPERDSEGRVSGVLVVARDLTDRKRAEDLLADHAVHDPLTGLANRVLLADRLQQAIMRLGREPGMLAVLFLDLDRFKVVNDGLGHGVGDQLLAEVARRVSAGARRVDTVARFGGDEFVVLCERLTGPDDAALIADRISRAVSAPLIVGDQELHPTVSIGIATTESADTTAEILIRDADSAMYQAKDRGRGRGSYQFFDAGVRERAVTRLTVESELRQGLEHGQFRLVYQPLRNLASGALVGVEALIRWERPDGSLVPPIDFIPVAEDSGLIVPIGAWVLDEALRQLAEWNARRPDGEALTMAVNLSARQLAAHGLVEDVAAALRRHGIAPPALCLEITETALLEDSITAAEVLRRLSALGVQLALDDFGTGYSSLGHLRRYPVDILKIDRMFVDTLGRDGEGAAIVGAVIAMAHALGMSTVGEGIETVEQWQHLLRLGCDDGQGYLFARPLPPDAVAAQRARHPLPEGHEAAPPPAVPTPRRRTAPHRSRQEAS